MKKRNIINIAFFLIIFIILLLNTLSQPLNNLDEIWNYNISRSIANGLVPYRDISMITSPLLAMITAIFLKLICNELIVTRILSVVLTTLTLYSLYKTMDNLKINNTVKYIIISILLLTLRNSFRLDYNWFIALIAIIITNLEIKNIEKKNNNLKYEFLIGILVGISICIKQSIGFLIAIVAILYNVIFLEDKQSIKTYIKYIFIRICGIILPIFLLGLYLYINKALYSFIDYCILGINTFKNSIPYITMIKGNNLYLKILAVLIPITYILAGIKIIINSIKKKDIKISFTLLTYSIALFAITFPIANDEHFLIGSLIGIILLVYETYQIIKKYLKINDTKYYIFIKTFIETFILISLIILLYATFNIYTKTTNENKFYNDLKYFKYIPMSENTYNSIIEMDNYIIKQDKKLYMLDASAPIYMIPIDRYNKDYDMFNVGNFGGRGQDGKIEDLENEQDIIVLLRNNSLPRNWQHPEKVRQYIENNWIKIDSFRGYDVYEKGK